MGRAIYFISKIAEAIVKQIMQQNFSNTFFLQNFLSKLFSTKIKPLSKTKPRVALVLGSGGARGWCHLGVLQELAHHNFTFSLIAGSSFGAIAGAFYAADRLAGFVKLAEQSGSFVKNLSFLDFDWRTDTGLISGKKFMARIEKNLQGVAKFNDLKLPLGIVTTDLYTMQEVFLREGYLFPAIRASIAIPGLITPLRYRHHQLGDGGISNTVPVNLAYHMGADYVIAVDLNCWHKKKYSQSILGTVDRSLEMLQNRVRKYHRSHFPANVYIEPKLKTDVNIFDLHRIHEGIAAGRRAVKEKLEEIERVFQLKKPRIKPQVRYIQGLDYDKALYLAIKTYKSHSSKKS